MLGIDNDDWTVQDTKECKKYDIKVKGYYEIGDADISNVRFTSDVLSLLLVNGLRITFNLY